MDQKELREIDFEIAEKVMGYKERRTAYYWADRKAREYPITVYLEAPDRSRRLYKTTVLEDGTKPENYPNIPPHYASTIEDAWEVVRRVRDWSFSRRIAFKHELGMAITRRVAKGEMIHPSEYLLLVEPVDICRAALSSVKEGE